MKIFKTTAGVEIPIQPISLFDLERIKNIVEAEYREAGKPIDPPTYEVKLELEGTSEFHPYTIKTIEDASSEDKEKWRLHLKAVEEMQEEMQERTGLIFLEGILYDLPEDDSWIAKRKKLFGDDIPEDPDEKRLYYINNVLLKTIADKTNLTLEIQKLSMTGADEEAIAAYEDMFRRQMAIQNRKITQDIKATIEKQEDVVLQSDAEGQSGGEGMGNDSVPIP